MNRVDGGYHDLVFELIGKLNDISNFYKWKEWIMYLYIKSRYALLILFYVDVYPLLRRTF